MIATVMVAIVRVLMVGGGGEREDEGNCKSGGVGGNGVKKESSILER